MHEFLCGGMITLDASLCECANTLNVSSALNLH